ncbi:MULTISPECIES: hypothetical protein [Photorhabdus]|nr:MULTISPECIES: hypothetical protein [Photorhabdus]MDB6368616.1 hypothetical protein [Photorhabdus bodei]
MTGVSECSQQRGNLKDDGYIIKRAVLLTCATVECLFAPILY